MGANIRRVFLVDYENTSIRGLYGISCLRENCKVVVFCSSPVIQKSVDDILKIYRERGVETCTFILKKTGKNALDFMITTYLGFEINAAIDKEIYIISADHGFESAIEMAKQLDPRMTVDFRRNIVEALPQEMRQGMHDIEESAGLLLTDNTAPMLMLEEKKTKVTVEQEAAVTVSHSEEAAVKASVPTKTASAESKSKKSEPEKTVRTEKKAAAEKVDSKKQTKTGTVPSLLKAVMRRKQEPAKDGEATVQKKSAPKPTVQPVSQNIKTVTPIPVAVKPDHRRVIVEVVDAEFVEVKDTKQVDAAVSQKAETVAVQELTPTSSKKQKSSEKKKRSEKKQKAEQSMQSSQSASAPKAVLTKKQKNEERIRLIAIMESDNRIPQKYHINLAAALVNATLWEECKENVANILGPANKHLLGDMKELFDKERA